MTMKDRHILQETLKGCARVQARTDYIAKRVTKARASKKTTKALAANEAEIDAQHVALEEAEPKGKAQDSNDKEKKGKKTPAPAPAEAPKCKNCGATPRFFSSALQAHFCSDACLETVKNPRPVPVAKGVRGPLGALVPGQKFFVHGVVGDYILENWQLAPGVFDAQGELRKCPVVRQVTQRRTATKPEVTLKPTVVNAWFEETEVTVAEDFALQTTPVGLQSNQAQNEQGDNMAAKKKAAKKSNGEAKHARYANMSFTVNASKIDEKLQKQLDNEEKNSHGVVVLRFCKSSRKALTLEDIITGVKATKRYKTEGSPDGLITGDVRILTEKGILTAKEA